MKILLSDLGKRYNREWIFRNICFEFESAAHCAITGSNGSGKSTLLQILAGAIRPSEGNIQYVDGEQSIHSEEIFRLVSFVAPYLELPTEMTLREYFNFHFSLKPPINNLTSDEIISRIALEKSSDKQIRYFSSGMTQRVKLAQAIFSNTPIVLLDEPTINLDESGIALYHSLISNYCDDRLVVVSSNDADEYNYCTKILPIQRYKNSF